MYRLLCCLGLLKLCTSASGAKHTSWDIAISTDHVTEFYKNKALQQNDVLPFWNLRAITYVGAYDTMLFVDKNNENSSISSYSFNTEIYHSLVKKKPNENIQDLTFDIVTNTLFWTDSSERSIFRKFIKPGSENDVYGNLFIKMDNEIPRAIDVDSCRGYIYWTNVNIVKPTIERARLDGTKRQVVISTYIYLPVSLVIDQQTKRLYWADDREGIHYSIESSDLEGNNRVTLVIGAYQIPNAITISKDSIYWVDLGFKFIWKLPKNVTGSQPEQYKAYDNNSPYGIVANYPVEESINNILECEALATFTKKLKIANSNKSTLNGSKFCFDMDQYCVHGVKDDSMWWMVRCNCQLGYTGERCEIFVCQNFCLHGDCSVTTDGFPTCRCNEGFTGDRCEINVCHAYCLNDGICSLNEEHKPQCNCFQTYEGSRCEITKVITTAVSLETIFASDVSTTKLSPEALTTTEIPDGNLPTTVPPETISEAEATEGVITTTFLPEASTIEVPDEVIITTVSPKFDLETVISDPVSLETISAYEIFDGVIPSYMYPEIISVKSDEYFDL